MSTRAVPFYCPYCGDEDLRPAEQTERVPPGAWYCAGCLRTFDPVTGNTLAAGFVGTPLVLADPPGRLP